MPGPIPLLAALSISIAIGSAGAILAWREAPKPGARSLALLLTGQVWWSACSFFRLRAPTVDEKLFWLMALWVGVVVIPFAWILFALQYTGRDEYVTRRTLGALAVVPVLTIVVVVTHPFHDLLNPVAAGYTSAGILRGEYTGIWYWVVAAYTYALGAVGVGLVAELIVSRAFTFRKQGIALFVGLSVPWTTNLLYVTGVFDVGIDPTPVAFAFSGAIYLYALKRFQLLQANPAPTRRARQMVFDGVQEAAIIVDSDDHVVDINDRGLEILDAEHETVLGAAAPGVVPKYDQLPQVGEMADYLTLETDAGERDFEVEVTKIRTSGDSQIGRVVTLNEVTDLLHQQQQLEVLNRVLRHNIRTETNLILGYAGRLSGEHSESVKRHARKIDELGEKGREAIDLFRQARSETDPRPLGELLEESVARVEAEFPDVAVEYRNAAPTARVDGLLDAVFDNVVENAAAHNDSEEPRVSVDARVEDGRATVTVADNGPGISDYELAVLSRGTESALEHGSGIGLWIIKWGTDLVDGSVRFSANEPAGTRVVIDVPLVDVDAEADVDAQADD